MNQNQAILDYMRDHGAISPHEAFAQLGIMRLAARIHDLRESGVAIKDQMVSKTDSAGKVVKRWKEYWV